jgi:hypothetical protein
MSVVFSPFQSDLSLMYETFPAVKPVQKGKRQDKWDPKPSEEQPGKQEAHNCISIRDPLRAKIIKKNNTSWHTKDILEVKDTHRVMQSTPLQLTEYYKDLIQHHVAARVALFFEQAVVCHDTPFHFEIADTEGQFFVAPTLKVQSESGSRKDIKYQAAHSSTIPGLKACLRKDFKSNTKPTYFSFLEGAHLGIQGNATVGLPDWVNKMDTLIDGHSKRKNGLRGDTIAIINQVAHAKINPLQATRQFLDHLHEKLLNKPKRSKTMTVEKREVIKVYLEQVQEMKALAAFPHNLKMQHPFFDSLLNVNVSQEKGEDIPVIRKIVFKRKYEVIREAQLLESKIKEIIDEGITHFTPEYQHFVRLCLIYQTRNDPSLLKALEKLFCISVPTIKQNSKLCASLEKEYKGDQTFYDNRLRDIRIQLRRFRKMEQSFQAMLLKEFRQDLRGYTQKKLSDKIVEVIAKEKLEELAKAKPDHKKITALESTATSPSTISRLENSRIHIIKSFKTPEEQRRKPLNLHYAKVISDALEIQPGHFFCSFFNAE